MADLGQRAAKPTGVSFQRQLAIGYVCAGQGDDGEDVGATEFANAIDRGEYDGHLDAIIDGTYRPSSQLAG